MLEGQSQETFSSYSMDGDLGICEGLERWRKKTGYIKRIASASCGLVAPWSLEGSERADSVEKWGHREWEDEELGSKLRGRVLAKVLQSLVSGTSIPRQHNKHRDWEKEE